MNEITIIKPDDWHLHFRDDDMLLETVPATARCFSRAIVMPNLVPPVMNADMALSYKERILSARPQGSDFMPLMTLYLTDKTSVEDIKAAKQAGVVAVKMYPAGATTNSDSGVTSVESRYPIFEALAENDMLLLIHGEVTHNHVDIFDREKEFIDQHMTKIVESVPNLKVVFEHITTKDASDFVLSAREGVAATITPQHLMMNRNDMLVGGVRPHNYCLPVLKRSSHQEALRQVVASGSNRFFLGTDSAPHARHKKENACGCAGCYSAWSALELYTQVFEELDALDKLEGFASLHGPDFYGLPRNTDTVTLVKEEWQVPDSINLANGEPIVPFFSGREVSWKLKA
ncbi:dihydroorotase [Marinomonas posidonica]|uniref:Dihydroorotase n=1 Tax=Marinomonas posidonica (strain CECT 7376 / NCIMB 14433 / IVIA-Po-181) TaxID=491952 RepID=F6CSC2_MARPP|nr:dihydroorotase [Marinomonas posidonica]AEF54976.1 Dihydroorotase [Marinomonas posidonica IVIA-Po-181]